MGATKFQFPGFFEYGVTEILATVAFGATGAPTLSTSHGKGVKSVTRNSAGNYTFIFGNAASLFGDGVEAYSAILGVQAIFEEDSGAPDAPIVWIVSKDLAAGSVTIQCASDASVATDPGNGETGYFRFTLSGQ
jgi:hypothetical protein